MELIDYTIERKGRGDKVFNLCPLGDIHYGNSSCDEEALQKAINWINKIDAYVIGMGDYLDAINMNDRRFDVRQVKKGLSLDDLVSEQFKGITYYLDQIPKDRWIAMLTGNHEETIRKRYFRDITQELCDRYEIPNLGYSGWIRLMFRRKTKDTKRPAVNTLKIFAHHGYGGARFRPTKRWKIEHLRDDKEYDIMIMGHIHTLDASRSVRQTIPNKGKLFLKEKTTIEMITGTFLKSSSVGNTNYGEIAGFGAEKTGVGTIVINFVKEDYKKGKEKIDLHFRI